jgi:hypothetical protein
MVIVASHPANRQKRQAYPGGVGRRKGGWLLLVCSNSTWGRAGGGLGEPQRWRRRRREI